MKKKLLFKIFKLLLVTTLILLTINFPIKNITSISSLFHQQGLDFGDAPEGALAYPNIGVIGSFPTCIKIGPSGWIQHGIFYMHLGQLVDPEGEGNAGNCVFPLYDRDECYGDQDAGLIIPQPFTINSQLNIVPCPVSKGTSLGKSCTYAVWGTSIDINVVNNFKDTAFFNLLIDWNQDGKWFGSSTCPSVTAQLISNEHAIMNFPIPGGFSGKLSTLNPPQFLIGPKSGYVWSRFTITERPVPTRGWDGSGTFEDGETEDYLLKIDESVEQKPTLDLEIELTNCPLHQDETIFLRSTLKDTSGLPIPGVTINFSINPAPTNNVRNIGWYESPSPNSTLHYGTTNASGIVRICLGSRNVENIQVTSTCVYGGAPLTKTVNVNFPSRPTEAKTTSFYSNGDLISNWYWLRDTGYTQYGEWTFTGVTKCPNYISLRSEHLVTNTFNGGRGYSARVQYEFIHPITGVLLGVVKDYLLNLWSPSDNVFDATGYKTIGSICVPSSYIIGGVLKIRIKRFSANTEHVAVNKDSLVLKMCEVCDKGGIIGNIICRYQDKIYPCSNIKVNIYDEKGNLIRTEVTDINGKFDTCKNLLPGKYKVVPVQPENCKVTPESMLVEVKACEKIEITFECDCCVKKEYGGIIGKITNACITPIESGLPCMKVKVNISGPLPLTIVTWSGYTDENGIFDTCFNLIPGDYVITPELTSCEFRSKQVTVYANKKSEVVFNCKCFGGIKGYIGCDKGPCKDTKVLILDEKNNIVRELITDSNGNFDTCFSLFPGTYYVKPISEKCKFTPEIIKVEVIAACSKHELNFKCDCCGECDKGGIIGNIICRYQDKIYPCSNIKVNIYDEKGNLIRTEVTDINGKFDTCKNLLPGKYKVVPVQPENCKVTPESMLVEVKACEKIQITFECDCCKEKKLGGIEGVVLDSSTQKPCEGVIVVVVGPLPSNSVAWWGKTDINGKYTTCLNLTPGDYIVYAKLPCELNEIKVTVVEVKHIQVNFRCKCEEMQKSVPLWLNPPYETLMPNTRFKKSVEVGKPSQPVINLMATKFVIKFDSALFEVEDVIEGDFLKQSGASTTFLKYIDNVNGRIVINTSRLGGTGASGFGTLAYLIFKVKNITTYTISEILLPEGESNLRDKYNNIIPHYNGHEKIEIGKERKLIGDFNKDGKIDFEDLVIFSLAYGKNKGDKGWDTQDPNLPGSPFNRCDIWDKSKIEAPPVIEEKPDGMVDFNDLMVFIINWNFYYIP